MDCRLLCPWDSPGKNIGVGCHFLLQGIFLTWGGWTLVSCIAADSLLSKPSCTPFYQEASWFSGENFEAGHRESAAQHPLHPDILLECGHLLQPSETHPDPSTGSGDAWLACGFPWIAVKVTLDEHARGSCRSNKLWFYVLNIWLIFLSFLPGGSNPIQASNWTAKVGLWDVSLSGCTSIQLTGPGMFWIIRNLVSLLQNPILNFCGLISHLWCGMCQTLNVSLITIWHNVKLLASCWCIIKHFSLLWNRNFIFYGFGRLGCRRESQG